MVRTFNTNSSNDIFIGQNGRLSIADNLEGVIKGCETATYAQFEEMILAQNLGVPNFQTVWNGVPNYQIYEVYLRNAILGVTGVTGIKSLDIKVKNNTLSYTATIISIYGNGVVSGSASLGV